MAVEAALESGRPVWLALTAGPDATLLEPKDFARIGRDAASLGVSRLLANCIAATRIAPYVEALARAGIPVGVYANAGDADEGLGWGADAGAAVRYAELADQWARLGATVVGGCCGTGPEHIRALRERFSLGVGRALGVGI